MKLLSKKQKSLKNTLRFDEQSIFFYSQVPTIFYINLFLSSLCFQYRFSLSYIVVGNELFIFRFLDLNRNRQRIPDLAFL